MTVESDAARRRIEVFAVGADGSVERSFTINPEDRERKLSILRDWTANAYRDIYQDEPRSVRVSDWPLLPGDKPVHGVERVTFAFPEADDEA